MESSAGSGETEPSLSESRVIAASGEREPVERVKWSRLLHARTWHATKKAISQPNRASAFGVEEGRKGKRSASIRCESAGRIMGR